LRFGRIHFGPASEFIVQADKEKRGKQMSLYSRITTTSAPAAVILIRIIVGGVFLSEGIQKFLFPDENGVGRFLKIGIPSPEVTAPFVGIVEIVCGALILLGFLTRLAAVPLIINMLVAILSTKIFLPAFVFVAASGPLVPRIRRSKVAGAFLDGVNAASLSLMAVVIWQLSRAAIVDLPTIVLLAISLILLIGFRVNSVWLVVGGAVIGLVLQGRLG
jgi:uncharacterized membrane protein YphA (DoxX/SURF4 family)